uniref:Cmp-n-acetylneuraminate-beta-galactosamide-alpha--sialyltransferase 2 n=1 Tax=Tetraselmis sp. GSL018 TaxID=582737 RepID=A0A061RCQ4_9CHLO
MFSLKNRDVLILALVVVGVRLLMFGEVRDFKFESHDRNTGQELQLLNRKRVTRLKGTERQPANSKRFSVDSQSRTESSVRQVDFDDKSISALKDGGTLIWPRFHPNSQGGATDLLGLLENGTEASWHGFRSRNWQDVLRPDMEFLVSQDSMYPTPEREPKTGHPLVLFKFRDHKGTVRQLHWEADFAEAANLPQHDWKWVSNSSSGHDSPDVRIRHGTCALVGNSGTLRDAGFGGEIDAHDAVVRINYAPVKGYESDVGSRTTYDLVNKENAMKLASGEHEWRTPKSTVFLFESHSRIIRAKVYSKLFQRPPLRTGKQTVLVLQPALMTASRTIYLAIMREVGDRQSPAGVGLDGAAQHKQDARAVLVRRRGDQARGAEPSDRGPQVPLQQQTDERHGGPLPLHPDVREDDHVRLPRLYRQEEAALPLL